MKYKVAFVGPEQIYTPLSNMDPEWDFQHAITSVSQFKNDVNSGKLAENTMMIIFFAGLYTQEPDFFAKMIGYMAPYAVTCILNDPRKDDSFHKIIKESVKSAQEDFARENPAYHINTPFFFIDYNEPRRDLNEAILSFISSPIINKENRDAVKVLMPESDIELEKNIEDWGPEDDYDNENITLPDAPLGAKGKVITVTSSKGGSGKSTVSMLLGAYIAKSSLESAKQGLEPTPLKVCVVDMDTRDGQLGFLNGAKKPPTIMGLFANGPNITFESITDNVWHSDKLHCDFIFAAKRPRRAREVPPAFYADLIQKLRAVYDIIILDTSVNYIDPLLGGVAYPLSDRIILVSDVSIASIFGMRRWILENIKSVELSPEERVDKSKVGIVINNVLQGVDMGPDKIEQAASGVPILSMIPSVPKLVTYAANSAQLEKVLSVPPIRIAIKMLAESIITEDFYNLADLED